MSSALPRLLCIMGSGETAPTMVSVHAELLGRLGPPPVPAVLLDTPFGFQENAGEICERALVYFARNVGHPITVASFRDRESASALEYETMLARIGEARYVFSGPGSPTYALRQWRGTAVPEMLAAKLRDGGCVNFASAAAVGLGAFALSVYEVYKVGEPPRWLEGLDLLGGIGVRAALIPHYNNAEGGTHDTRYCYMGERRLRMLEEMLPDDAGILGVDEHTAAVVDLGDGTLSVRGRGVVTWRYRGVSRRVESGATVAVGELCVAGTPTAPAAAVVQDADVEPSEVTARSPFMDAVAEQSTLAESAFARHDVGAAVEAMLDIDTQLHDWSTDTFDSDEQERARATLRRQVVRLGELAREGASDPRERLAPIVDRLLALRGALRGEGQYALADRLRDLLVDAGIEIHDTPGGSTWEPAQP